MQQYQHTKSRSKKQNLKKILFGSVVFVGLSIGSAQNSYAQIPVVDAQENSETILQYILQGLQWLKQQLQYTLQSKQFATQLENLLAIGAFVWTEAHKIIADVHSLDDVHSIYQLVYGSIGDAMKTAQSFYDFNNNPCSAFYPAMGEAITSSSYFPNHCHYTKTGQAYGMPQIIQAALARLPISTSSLLYALPSPTLSLLSTINMNPNIEAATLNTIHEQENDSTVQTNLNTSETQLNLQQQSDLQNDADNIDTIQNLQTSGNLQALQKQNQLIGNIATQFIKLRALTIAKNAAEAQQREEETKDRAKAETFYYQVFLTNSYAPMKKHVWK
ncbi:MAG: hypothetical protein J6V89_00375 [Acetobacter sp.]|nr:hypothetical protein [Acetobacter sp.]